jgi:endonuclease/exonuclease/phosphatase (EEP) superfamily protein YafD
MPFKKARWIQPPPGFLYTGPTMPPVKVKNRFLSLLLKAGLVLLALFSLTPYAPVSNIATDLPSHFVLQYAFGCLILLPFALWLRLRKRWYVLWAFCLALNTATLSPYIAWTASTPVAKAATFKVLQVNTLYLNKNPAMLLALIGKEKPDVITVAELNDTFAASLKTLAEDYPYQSLRPETNTARGLGVLSKLPMTHDEIVTFFDARIPALRFDIVFNDIPIHFLSMHPFTPLANIVSRDGDLRVAAEQYAENPPTHFIVTGDFNATPWSPAFKRFTHHLNLKPARQGQGILPSWPGFFPALFRIPIDHIMVSQRLSVIDYKLGTGIGSDHLPTIAIIALKAD